MGSTMIHNWNEIKDDFDDGTLLVGNGGSIAVYPNFNYGSLLDVAQDTGLITEQVTKIFKYLGTNDFELVLNMVWHTLHVNEALEIHDEVTEKTYDDIRSALIEAVRKTHPPYGEIEDALKPIYEFMKPFKTVIDLSYDLIVYWAMLASRAEYGNWFKDCFINGTFRYEDWADLYEPYGANGATLVFYPHGNLVLASSLKGGDEKLVRQGEFENLLERIVSTWRSGTALPLFVSEGDSTQKRNAILRSGYLSTVYNSVLPDLDDNLVVYGWSLGEQDDHIVARVCNQDIDHIAISVYTNGKSRRELEAHCNSIEYKIGNYNKKSRVRFFDSASEGSWARP